MKFTHIISGHRFLLLAGILLGVLGSCAALAQPLVIGVLIRAVSEGQSITGSLAIIVVLFAVDALLSAGNSYLIGRAGENIVFDLRFRLVGRLLRSRLGDFQKMEVGDLFTRMIGDTTLACMVITQAVAQLVSSVFMVVGCIAFMALIDAALLLTTLACLGGASIVALLLARQVRISSLSNRRHTSDFGSGLQRVLGALSTVKASRAESTETGRLGELANRARRSGIRVTAFGALLQPAMNVGTQLSLAVVITWGMARVATGDLPAADLTAFVMYLFYLVSPLVMLFLSLGQIQQGRAAVQRVTEIAELPVEEEESLHQQLDQPREFGSMHDRRSDSRNQCFVTPGEVPAVTFDRVEFSYNGTTPVLNSVSFSVPSRGLTAVVGPSGAGKTTLFQLIERFYQPDNGSIRIGGENINEMDLYRLRGMVGYVEQDSPLMRGTVLDNLTYARPDADDQQIEHALRRSHLTDVVASLPHGLDTELGERGVGLSGGQRQRLAIARTLLQEPAVILLDEATAHVDSETEAALRDAVAEAAQQCAVLTIAHRISTVRNAEQILVMDAGEVQATGTHDELIETNAMYHTLVEGQLETSARA